MRLFVGFYPSPHIYQPAINLAKEIDFGGNRISYISPQNFHGTIVFLGDVLENQLTQMTKVCEQIQPQVKSFQVNLKQWQLTPKFQPTVLSLIPDKAILEFDTLQKLLVTGLSQIKPQLETRPIHLTVVRLRTHLQSNQN